MARPKVPEAGPRHPARKVLAEHTAQEIADALGLKAAASIYAARKDLRVTLADRIAEAFSGPVSGGEPGKGRAPEGVPPAARAGTRAPSQGVGGHQQVGVAADAFLRQVEEGQVVKDMEALARTAIANIAKAEFVPAIKELVNQLGQANGNGHQPPAFLVIPLTGSDLAKLRGKS